MKEKKQKQKHVYGFKCSIKIRLYLDALQREYVNRLCGCCRFLYNDVLDYKTTIWSTEQRSVETEEVSRHVNELKNTYPWLKEVHSKALQQSLLDLNRAMTNCFQNGFGFPKFKRKIDHCDSFRLPVDAFIGVTGNRISFIKKLKDIQHYKCSRRDEKLLNKYQKNVRSVTIRRNADDTYTASVLIDFPSKEAARQFRLKKVKKTDELESLDAGINHFTTDSSGHKTAAIKRDKKEIHYEKCQRKHSLHLERAKTVWKKQQKLLPKEERSEHMPYSKSLDKSRVRAAKAAADIKNSRERHHHDISNYYINNYRAIAIESLNVSGMMKNCKLARAIQCQAFYLFFSMLKYKAEWYERQIIEVGRFFASSKLCSECGYKYGFLKLSERKWTCPRCGKVHDRDINAAINIKTEALRLLSEKDKLPVSRRNVKHVERPPVGERDSRATRGNLSNSSVSVKHKNAAGQIIL